MNPINNSDTRMMRGMEIAEKNVISENADGSFSVPSQTRADVSYEVRILGEAWVCNCPDFENRADQIEACKHILGTKFWIAARVELQQKPKPKVFAEDSIQCVKCGSIRVIRFGSRGGKQTYRCNDCGNRFTPSLIKKAKYSPETITLTLDLYFSGMSYNKIARALNDNYDMNLGSATIYRWAKRYVPIISEYVNSLTPQLSETWHADELFVKMRGGVKHQKSENMAFLWNAMDRKTRFLIASKLSKHRDIGGAARMFQEALRNSHGSEPERILTDSLKAYGEGMRFAPFEKMPEHIANVGINKPHATNNRIERLNGTLRERTKVQRGWKSYQTPIAEGQRIHYNFVKPHMALEGQTPAQRAGVGSEEKDSWSSLLKSAITTRGETRRENTQE